MFWRVCAFNWEGFGLNDVAEFQDSDSDFKPAGNASDGGVLLKPQSSDSDFKLQKDNPSQHQNR